ncbi:phosphoenolpyruvate hydrolase family protein [soil metagenome]
MTAARPDRAIILATLREKIERGLPIVGAGAGTGISAKAAEQGGADLIVIYNSGRYRMAGRGSLAGYMPYGDANAIVMEMASEVLTVVEAVPVLAGVCGTDPFRNMEDFLTDVQRVRFAGVQNFPTVGLIDGTFRQHLEETGISYAMEVDMIRSAHELGLLTSPYCFDEHEAALMADAGADIVVAHMGLTTNGMIGARTSVTLADAVERIQRIADAAHAVASEVMVICHGGPIAEPDDAAFILERTRGVVGFYGASSMERLPVERAIAEQVRSFGGIRLRPPEIAT